jgi:eukaryotic-like serine/threonine-protein kinase
LLQAAKNILGAGPLTATHTGVDVPEGVVQGGIVLETVGRYKVQEKIGEGAMADVYRAYDPSINRTLAIKVLKNEFLQDEEYAGRFLREAKAAGALSHPNIVTIFDVGEANGHPFIVMELLDGKPLDKLMSEKQKLGPEETMNIGMQLARALDYAHGQGIIHRDIKPSNIMISADEQSVKILDYGIARLNENDALLGQEVLKTQVGAVLGTPRYMSPEQALGQTSDGRSDLYSVGIVLYELLTGKKAFSSGSMATLMLQITQQDPEAIEKLAPEVPGGLTFIVNKLLAKKPEKRFQKGLELAAALKRELASIESLKAEKTKPRSMPLPIKVTLFASLFTLAVLAGSIWAALAKQNKVMQQMAITSGSAISGFVANNIGTNMLSEDWDRVSAFVKVAAEDKNVDEMVVVDNNNVVRGAKNDSLEGKTYRPASGPVLSSVNNVTVVETQNKSGIRVFQFRQPVIYAQGTYGKVYVSLRQNALEAASALSRNVLLGLGLVTLLSVIAVAYTIAALLARPIKRLKEAMADAALGKMDFRISHNRKDEFGELFDGFNRLATAVQGRIDTADGFIGDATSLGSTRTSLTVPAASTEGIAAIVTGALAASPFAKPAEAESPLFPEAPDLETEPAVREHEMPEIDVPEFDVDKQQAVDQHADEIIGTVENLPGETKLSDHEPDPGGITPTNSLERESEPQDVVTVAPVEQPDASHEEIVGTVESELDDQQPETAESDIPEPEIPEPEIDEQEEVLRAIRARSASRTLEENLAAVPEAVAIVDEEVDFDRTILHRPSIETEQAENANEPSLTIRHPDTRPQKKPVLSLPDEIDDDKTLIRPATR